MLLFNDARAVVRAATHIEPRSDGFEDATHFCVPLEFSEVDDTVWLVDKDTGELEAAVYWDVEEKLREMKPVAV